VDPQTNRARVTDAARRIRNDGTADTLAVPRCAPPAANFLFKVRAGGYVTSMTLPFTPSEKVVVTSRGTVWCTPSGQYTLFAGTAGDSLVQVFHKEVAPIPVSEPQLKQAKEMIADFEKNVGPMISENTGLPKVLPAISQLFADDEGRAWVRLTSSPDSMPSFDVIDATGRVVATVQSPGRIGYTIHVARGKLYTVVADKDDVPTVVRFGIVKR
jgi:hypothetical protein